MSDFLNYPQEVGAIQLDLPDELYQFGSITPNSNERLTKIVVSLYLSGVYAPTSNMYLLINRDSDGQLLDQSKPVALNQIGNGFLGRVRFDFAKRFPLTAGEKYNVSIKMEGYTPSLDPAPDAPFCAIIKNSPATLTYTSANSLIESTAAFELYNEE